MGNLQVHTAYGWRNIEDLILASIKCDKCGELVRPEGAGFVQCDPPEALIYFCGPCRAIH